MQHNTNYFGHQNDGAAERRQLSLSGAARRQRHFSPQLKVADTRPAQRIAGQRAGDILSMRETRANIPGYRLPARSLIRLSASDVIRGFPVPQW